MPREPAAGGRDVLGAGAEVSGAAAELEAEKPQREVAAGWGAFSKPSPSSPREPAAGSRDVLGAEAEESGAAAELAAASPQREAAAGWGAFSKSSKAKPKGSSLKPSPLEPSSKAVPSSLKPSSLKPKGSASKPSSSAWPKGSSKLFTVGLWAAPVCREFAPCVLWSLESLAGLSCVGSLSLLKAVPSGWACKAKQGVVPAQSLSTRAEGAARRQRLQIQRPPRLTRTCPRIAAIY